jgi:hypothetical protein
MPLVHESASATAIVESTRPRNDNTQNGMISRHMSLASRFPHVQRRFRWYEGTVATAVASTFAIQAAIPSPSVAAASVVKLITVVITETPMQRARRVTRADDD